MLCYCVDSHRPLTVYTLPTISKEEILSVQFSIKTLLATISCSKHAGILAISRPFSLLNLKYINICIMKVLTIIKKKLQTVISSRSKLNQLCSCVN